MKKMKSKKLITAVIIALIIVMIAVFFISFNDENKNSSKTDNSEIFSKSFIVLENKRL